MKLEHPGSSCAVLKIVYAFSLMRLVSMHLFCCCSFAVRMSTVSICHRRSMPWIHVGCGLILVMCRDPQLLNDWFAETKNVTVRNASHWETEIGCFEMRYGAHQGHTGSHSFDFAGMGLERIWLALIHCCCLYMLWWVTLFPLRFSRCLDRWKSNLELSARCCLMMSAGQSCMPSRSTCLAGCGHSALSN